MVLKYWMNAICLDKLWNTALLFEVCMIKTTPRSTLSPQMWCIKNIKDRFARTQIYWQEFVNACRTQKIRSDLFSKNLFSTPYLLWSKAIIALKCVHIRLHQLDTRFVSLQIPQKSHECAVKLTDLWNTKLWFDLSYKFINGSFAFSCG